MTTYTKVLISSAAALLTTQVEATGLHNSCLSLSDATIAEPEYQQAWHTNEADLTSAVVTPDMRLDGFITCRNDDEAIVGLQFFLSDTPWLGYG